jgi:hypothetical protein
MIERLQKKLSPPKKTLTELMNDKSVLSGREVFHNLMVFRTVNFDV